MANEMRDRLKTKIEIARNDWWEKACHHKTSKASADYIADYLLDDGWVRPPCKAGDKVYFIDTCTTAEDFGKKYVSWGEVLQLSFNGFGKWVVLTSKHLLNIDEVFPTKSEAEQNLKEMRGV